ncbi:MAG: NADAR family protein [Candidatus Methanomethylophilaceae archaeon]|nr:NADAR family protein [Candidatus Methanomethylophilaceae archaeon]
MVPRKDWEDVRLSVMEAVQTAKFDQHPDLKRKLIETGDAELVYNNECGDEFWGVYNGVGENNLGKVLMKVRDGFVSERS